MDVISYSYADEQKKKIDKFVADPKDINGIVTVPKVIQAGSDVTIPTNRQVVMRELTVENGASVTLEGNGEIFIPNGGVGVSLPVVTTDSIETATTTKTILTDDIVKQTGGILQDIDGVALYADRGLKNLLINGGFDVWQRGTGTSQTSSGYGSDDRWLNQDTGTISQSQQIFPLAETSVDGNPKYYSRRIVVAGTLATDYKNKGQKIESVKTLSGSTATVSFWARVDAPKNISIEFKQNFGTGGTPSAEVTGIGSQKIAITSSWAKYSATVAIPSISDKTLGSNGDDFLQLTFWFSSGSFFDARTDTLGQQSGTFDIAQVQLEEGSVATPFEQRPIGLELSLCKRYLPIYNTGSAYYCHGMGIAKLATNASVNIPTKEISRIIPTSVSYSGSLELWDGVTFIPVTAIAIDAGQTSKENIALSVTTAGGLTQYRSYILLNNNDANAKLIIDTEL